MASEITPGQGALLIGTAHQSVQLPGFDGFVFTPRTPGRKDTRIYAARADLILLDDLREVLRESGELVKGLVSGGEVWSMDDEAMADLDNRMDALLARLGDG